MSLFSLILLKNPFYLNADEKKESIKNKKVMYVFNENKKQGLLFDDGSVAVEALYDKFFTMIDGRIRAEKSGFSLLLTDAGVALKGEYLRILEFKDDVSSVVSKENKHGFINKDGKVIIAIEYEDAGNFSEGVAPVKKDGKWGYISKSGEIQIPFKFMDAKDFSDGLAVVSDGKWYGYIDVKGNLKIAYQFDSADSFKKGVAVVMKDKKNMVIEKTGEIIYTSQNSIMPLEIGENVSVLKFLAPPLMKNGKIIVEEKDFDSIGKFYEKRAVFRKQNKYGLIDENGRKIVSAEFEGLSDFENGRSITKQNGKQGMIDVDGKYIIQPEYDQIVILSETTVASLKSGTIEIHSGSKVERIFSDADEILSGKKELIIIKKNKKTGVINEKGEIVINFGDEKLFFQGDMFSYFQNGKMGLLDINGKKITPAKFDKICGFVDGLALVFEGKTKYYVNEEGNKVFDGSPIRRVDWKDLYACGIRSEYCGMW
jgi:hypothetical protein